MLNKFQECVGLLGEIQMMCERIEYYEDMEEILVFLQTKYSEMCALEETVNDIKEEHQKELKTKIKNHVEEYKENKKNKKPTPPAPPASVAEIAYPED